MPTSATSCANPPPYSLDTSILLTPCRTRVYGTAGGNGRLVQGLSRGLPVLYGSPVAEVRHGPGGVAVVTAGGATFEAAAAVVTLPLGVLKVSGTCGK